MRALVRATSRRGHIERYVAEWREGDAADPQAMAKKISWWQAAEILGISERTMRRWKFGYEKHGFRALFDKRKGKQSLQSKSCKRRRSHRMVTLSLEFARREISYLTPAAGVGLCGTCVGRINFFLNKNASKE